MGDNKVDQKKVLICALIGAFVGATLAFIPQALTQNMGVTYRTSLTDVSTDTVMATLKKVSLAGNFVKGRGFTT